MKPITIKNTIIIRETQSFNQYLKEIGSIPLLSPEEEKEIGIRAYCGDTKAQDELVKHNLRFVISVAKNYTGPETFIEDLVNEGNIGLIEASRKFNPYLNIKFISYAVWIIRSHLNKYQEDNGRLIRIPRNKLDAIRNMNKHINKHSQQVNDDVYIQELDNEAYDYLKTLDSTRIHSLDKPQSEDSDSTLLDTLEDTMFQITDNTDLKRKLTIALDTLKPTHKAVLMAYYGLNGDEPKNLLEIGIDMNLTKQRITQIRQNAFKQLRAVLSNEILQELN